MLYGAILALIFPDLTGLNFIGVFIYYFEHVWIFPIGYSLIVVKYGISEMSIK